jgi:hypothetical protein
VWDPLGLGWLPMLILALPLLAALYSWFSVSQRADALGYPSLRAYLLAAPRSDAEKRDAADLALKGLVWCVVGMLFAPFVLAGLIPLFYGGRKLIYASMGLGLVDDSDQTRA